MTFDASLLQTQHLLQSPIRIEINNHILHFMESVAPVS